MSRAEQTDVYPLTVVKTRYGGVYEGGPWAAFNCHAHEIPEAAFGDDTTCMFWWENPQVTVATGESVEDAVSSLEWTLQREIEREAEKVCPVCWAGIDPLNLERHDPCVEVFLDQSRWEAFVPAEEENSLEAAISRGVARGIRDALGTIKDMADSDEEWLIGKETDTRP